MKGSPSDREARQQVSRGAGGLNASHTPAFFVSVPLAQPARFPERDMPVHHRRDPTRLARREAEQARTPEASPVKLFSFGLAFVALAAGCDRRGGAGGPGATDTGSKPLYGQADNTFNLTAAAVSVKQGDAEPVTIGIKRGTNFDQDVTVAFADVPNGVTIDPAGPVIKSGATDVKVTLAAAEDAAPGEYTVKVVGHPGAGGDATNQFKLTVAKKDSFTLTVPFWTTGLKQGEAKAFSVGITRDKRFDQDVTLRFDGLPKGVTVEPATAVIRNGEPDAKLILKAADDAALGDFAVRATGHPTKGADATHEFRFKVAKK
jgi:hypothetical protein